MQTLYAQLRDDLRARILDGRLAPHAKLPSESELTSLHGISRITVRQALGDLQKEGLIVRMQGKGAFVAPPRSQQSLDRLQGLGEALTGQGEVHSQRLAIKRVRPPAEVASLLQLAAGAEAFQLSSVRYLDRQPLSVNTSWFPLELGERFVRLDASGRDFIDVIEKDLGRPVARAELEITAAAMPAKEARMLKMEPGAPALRVTRVLHGQDGSRLQVERAIYRGDAFSYRLSLAR